MIKKKKSQKKQFFIEEVPSGYILWMILLLHVLGALSNIQIQILKLRQRFTFNRTIPDSTYRNGINNK